MAKSIEKDECLLVCVPDNGVAIFGCFSEAELVFVFGEKSELGVLDGDLEAIGSHIERK